MGLQALRATIHRVVGVDFFVVGSVFGFVATVYVHAAAVHETTVAVQTRDIKAFRTLPPILGQAVPMEEVTAIRAVDLPTEEIHS